MELTSVNCAKFEVVSCLHEFAYRYRHKYIVHMCGVICST